MPDVSFDTLLELVGDLSNEVGERASRQKFRGFLLKQGAKTAAVYRELLRSAKKEISPQYNKALQDVVVLAGQLLGFNVSFGSYDDIDPALGHFDGLWEEPMGQRCILIEVRPTAHYSLQREHLEQAMGLLVEARKAKSASSVFLLVVCARPDQERERELEVQLNQTGRPNQARWISVAELEDLISLVEQCRLDHTDVVRLLYQPELSSSGVLTTIKKIHEDRSIG
jgi:hypothetical protein